MKKICMLVLTIMMFSSLAIAQEYKILSAHDDMSYPKRVDSVIFMIDQSGSMMMSDKIFNTKMGLAKQALININTSIPDSVIGLNSNVSLLMNDIFKQYMCWNKPNVNKMLTNISEDKDIYGRLTNMHESLVNSKRHIKTDKFRKTAVFLVTDGEWNLGKNPENAIKTIYKEYPNVVFHIISLADTPKGLKTLHNIVLLHKDSQIINANKLLDNKEAFTFAEKTIFGEYPIISAHFKFDQYKMSQSDKNLIKNTYDEVQKTYIVDLITIKGWTDKVGTDKYNQKLSMNRAEVVQKYLDFSPMTLEAEAHGKSFKYDNGTKEGRYLNRRADIYFR